MIVESYKGYKLGYAYNSEDIGMFQKRGNK